MRPYLFQANERIIQCSISDDMMLLTVATNESDVAAESTNHQRGDLILAHAQIHTRGISKLNGKYFKGKSSCSPRKPMRYLTEFLLPEVWGFWSEKIHKQRWQSSKKRNDSDAR